MKTTIKPTLKDNRFVRLEEVDDVWVAQEARRLDRKVSWVIRRCVRLARTLGIKLQAD